MINQVVSNSSSRVDHRGQLGGMPGVTVRGLEETPYTRPLHSPSSSVHSKSMELYIGPWSKRLVAVMDNAVVHYFCLLNGEEIQLLTPSFATACKISGLKSAHIHHSKQYIRWSYNKSTFNTVRFFFFFLILKNRDKIKTKS